MNNEAIGSLVHASAGPGVLHRLTGVIAQHRGDIVSVEIHVGGLVLWPSVEGMGAEP